MDRPVPLPPAEFFQRLAGAECSFRDPVAVEEALAPFVVLLQDALVHKRGWAFEALRQAGRRMHVDTEPLDGNPRAMFAEALRRVGVASRGGEVGAINLDVFCQAGFRHVGDGRYFRDQ